MKHFMIEFTEASEYIPEDYLREHKYWYIDSSVLPNTRRPISKEEKDVHVSNGIHYIEDVNSQWGDTEFSIFKTFELVLTKSSEPAQEEPEEPKEPKTISIQPKVVRTIVEPEPPVVKPEPPVVKPEPPVVKPEPPVVKPEPPVVKPEPPVVKPEPPVVKPESPVVKPEPPVVKPEPPVVKPEPPVVKPEPPVVKPESPVMKVEPPVVKPESPVMKVEPPVVKPESPVMKAEPYTIPPPVRIYPPDMVTSTNADTPEIDVFNAISAQLKKVRNRKLKIEVLIGDLEGCSQQGFAVDAAYQPLQHQIDQIREFEVGILQELKKVVQKIEQAYPAQY